MFIMYQHWESMRLFTRVDATHLAAFQVVPWPSVRRVRRHEKHVVLPKLLANSAQKHMRANDIGALNQDQRVITVLAVDVRVLALGLNLTFSYIRLYVANFVSAHDTQMFHGVDYTAMAAFEFGWYQHP